MTADIDGRTQNSKSTAKSCLYANNAFVLSSRGKKVLLVLISHKKAVIKVLILKARLVRRPRNLESAGDSRTLHGSPGGSSGSSRRSANPTGALRLEASEAAAAAGKRACPLGSALPGLKHAGERDVRLLRVTRTPGHFPGPAERDGPRLFPPGLAPRRAAPSASRDTGRRGSRRAPPRLGLAAGTARLPRPGPLAPASLPDTQLSSPLPAALGARSRPPAPGQQDREPEGQARRLLAVPGEFCPPCGSLTCSWGCDGVSVPQW